MQHSCICEYSYRLTFVNPGLAEGGGTDVWAVAPLKGVPRRLRCATSGTDAIPTCSYLPYCSARFAAENGITTHKVTVLGDRGIQLELDGGDIKQLENSSSFELAVNTVS